MVTEIMYKTVLLTGASGGLGQAVLNKFLSADYRIAVSRHDETTGISAGNILEIQADLTSEKSAGLFVQKAAADCGIISAAVLMVGGFAMGNIRETSESDIEKMFRLNFLTTWFTAQNVFLHMKKKGYGRIVLIGSKPGQQPESGSDMVAYTLSKAQIFALAELLNGSGYASDVVTSVIVPGTIDTMANRKAMPDADFSKWVKPEKIADTIFYACNASKSELKDPVFNMY